MDTNEQVIKMLQDQNIELRRRKSAFYLMTRQLCISIYTSDEEENVDNALDCARCCLGKACVNLFGGRSPETEEDFLKLQEKHFEIQARCL
jgi:hypothetical protein